MASSVGLLAAPGIRAHTEVVAEKTHVPLMRTNGEGGLAAALSARAESPLSLRVPA